MSIFSGHVEYVGTVINYILAEMKRSPLDSREIGGILRRDFGISGRENWGVKREIMSALQNICYIVKGPDDVPVYYASQEQYNRYRNQLM